MRYSCLSLGLGGLILRDWRDGHHSLVFWLPGGGLVAFEPSLNLEVMIRGWGRTIPVLPEITPLRPKPIKNQTTPGRQRRELLSPQDGLCYSCLHAHFGRLACSAPKGSHGTIVGVLTKLKPDLLGFTIQYNTIPHILAVTKLK